MRYAALLRGINVGGKHRLPMKDLVAIFEALGCEDVRTYVQSGNVVFGADAALARRLPMLATDAIRARCGFDAPVQVRSRRQLTAAVDRNPFADADPAHLALIFLSSKPTAKAAAGLDPNRSPGDAFALIGSEVFVHQPNGVARSKLTNAWFDSRLGVVSTGRNWRTVGALIDLLAG